MDFTSIFGGEALTLEQFADKTKAMKLADLSAGDYVARGKYEEDVKKLKSDLADARNTISALETNKGDAEALQAELEKYKQAEAERQRAEQEAAQTAKLMERFRAVKGDKAFSSEFAEKGVLDAFQAALADPNNVGKGDAELFDALTKDKEGVFASKHPDVNMGGFGSNFGDGGEPGKMPTFF